jgi:hypothetical protein
VARHHPSRESVILPVGATDGRNNRWVSFPLRAFESASLSRSVEVKVEDIDPGAPTGNRIETPAARRAGLESLSAEWRAMMDRPELVDVVADKLAGIEAEKRAVAARLGEAQREAASPLSEAVGHLRVVGTALEADDGDDNRARCQAAIRRAVESLWCLFAPGRGWRVAAVQVWFKGGRHRNYVIVHRPAAKNQHGGDRPATTMCVALSGRAPSVAGAEAAAPVQGLRRRHRAALISNGFDFERRAAVAELGPRACHPVHSASGSVSAPQTRRRRCTPTPRLVRRVADPGSAAAPR